MLNSKELLAEEDYLNIKNNHHKLSTKNLGNGLLCTWTQHEENYGELASSRLQWIMYTAKMTLASMVGKCEIQAKMTLAKMVCKYQIQAKMTLAGMVGKYQTQANIHRPRTGATWGKTVRGQYGQNGTGAVRAKRYGAQTGYGAGAVRGTVWARYVARTFHRMQPFECPYCLLLGLPLPCPYGHVYWDSSY